MSTDPSRACGTVVAAAGTVVAILAWPGLARPSTTLSPSAPPVVDGRHKAGHDTEQMGPPARYFNAHAARAGRPDYSFGGSVALCFNRYVQFSGRAPRPEYRYFVLFMVLVDLCVIFRYRIV